MILPLIPVLFNKKSSTSDYGSTSRTAYIKRDLILFKIKTT